jgi:hypothetical protein
MEPGKAHEDVPLTVILSSEKKTRGLVTVFDEVAAIRSIKVHRNQLSGIPESWKSGCGFYILVSDISDGKYHSYVGKATQNNLHARVASHRREKDNWTYAFLFQRDTSNGLTSTQASYVEGAVHRILSDCPWISVINNQIAGDKTLADHEVFYMNQVVKSALRILNIFGYTIEETPDEIQRIENAGKKYYGVSIAALLKSGLLHEGEDIISLSDKTPATATLGKKGIIFEGKEHSPSGAAKGVLALYPEAGGNRNGWSFWGVNRGEKWISLDDFRNHYLSQKALYENSLLMEKNIDFDNAVKTNELNRQDDLNKRDIPILPSINEEDEILNEVIFADVQNEHADLDPARHADSRVRIYELIDSGLLEEGMILISTHPEFPAEAEIASGGIAFNGNVYPSPTIAGKYARRIYDPTATEDNGWEFWEIQSPGDSNITLSKVLDDFLEV